MSGRETATTGWPLRVFGSLVHVAGLASHLLSDAFGVMTGAVVDIDQNVAGAYPE
jgi:hypothetical protein